MSNEYKLRQATKYAAMAIKADNPTAKWSYQRIADNWRAMVK